jgi:hypothetical protein
VSLAAAHELGFERFHLGAHLIGAAERHPRHIEASGFHVRGAKAGDDHRAVPNRLK